jgi:SAM-dependent methyltransferase
MTMSSRRLVSSQRLNAWLWDEVDDEYVQVYANRLLQPPEAMLLLRYHERLTGRVLEIGCGAGRLTGYLAELTTELEAFDISPAMVDYCRREYPQVKKVRVGDMTDMSGYAPGSFDAVVAIQDVIGILDHAERMTALGAIRRVLADGGLFLLAAHNRLSMPLRRTPVKRAFSAQRPLAFARGLSRLPRSLRNVRRLRAFEREELDYALGVDEAHEFRLVLYYIAPDAMERQLAGCGFRLRECVGSDGRIVSRGDPAPRDDFVLHYAADAIT